MSPKYNNREAKEARIEDMQYEDDDKKEKLKHKQKVKKQEKQNKKIDRRQ